VAWHIWKLEFFSRRLLVSFTFPAAVCRLPVVSLESRIMRRNVKCVQMDTRLMTESKISFRGNKMWFSEVLITDSRFCSIQFVVEYEQSQNLWRIRCLNCFHPDVYKNYKRIFLQTTALFEVFQASPACSSDVCSMKMNTGHWCNDTGRATSEYTDKNLYSFHFIETQVSHAPAHFSMVRGRGLSAKAVTTKLNLNYVMIRVSPLPHREHIPPI
jgi:hypothetical protein